MATAPNPPGPPAAPASPPAGPTQQGTLPTSVSDDLKLLFSELTAPEDQVIFIPTVARPTLDDINGTATTPGSVDSFELRTGPSDLDAYYDFYTVQVAFEDLWQQLTADSGIYETWNCLMDATLGAARIADRSKQFFFVDADGNVTKPDGTPVTDSTGKPIVISELTSAEELQNFLDFIRAEFGITTQDAPPLYNDLANSALSLVNITADLFNQLNRLGHATGHWKPGHELGLNDGNWPDDVLGTSGKDAATPFSPIEVPGPPISRYDYLRSTLVGINSIVANMAVLPPEAMNTVKNLLQDFDDILSERYAFDVFAPNSINYGLVINYRQHWTPIAYQVGDLVSTIPLAPQEVRKYTTKHVVKHSRNIKEMQDSLRATRQELSDTTRLDGQVVSKARSNSNFQQNASGSFGNSAIFKVSASMQQGTDQSVESDQTKNDFHEATSKSAQEYRNEHKSEIDVSVSQEDEDTSYREIRNPNAELTVTYLFYELQRRYSVQETLNKITPVIMVANDVPSPHQIDEGWLTRYDWILKRVILDDSFVPALDYLSNGYTGTELQLEVLKDAVEHEKMIVDQIAQQVSQANDVLNTATLGVQNAEKKEVADDEEAATLASIKKVFDPLGLAPSPQDGNGDRARVDFAKEALDRAQTKTNQLLAQLQTETTALQRAIDKYVAAAKDHFNKLTQIDRLRAHVKDNILYYMQGIWTYENPDQRYFRLYDIDVPTFGSGNGTVQATGDSSPWATVAQGVFPSKQMFTIPQMPLAVLDGSLKLYQVADIDNLLGFKGNYMIFPVVNFNYMNWMMMKDYLEFDIDPNAPGGGTVVAKDPDPLAGMTLSSLQTAFEQIYAKNPESFNKNESYFQEIMRRFIDDENDEIVIPSHSLYIEALPGTHPLLEDYMLIHRNADAREAQAHVRRTELENLRLAARISENILGDPDIDKVIVVGPGENVNIDAGQ